MLVFVMLAVPKLKDPAEDERARRLHFYIWSLTVKSIRIMLIIYMKLLERSEYKCPTMY